ncbi:serine hydrolase domain-containing protein [Winogradskyella flava]|uniref:Beta-lactamase family protein n=1 Tax=Winogradskyella flava TaxID=1884876 RepID=A0A842IQK9_9FLAO|nr:serine hydrolase domain-containing protein [Winogradskyella flava]MBC2845091.1 beta-lactamase family protein [Winogradskyella flava]
MKIRVPIITIALLYFTSCSKDSDSIDSYLGIDIPKNSIDSYLDSKMTSYNIPGLSIAIINNGEVVYHKTKGYADIEHQKPVTNNTIFEGASISKSVFAYFVMKFVEEGKLDLDKPLYQYMEYPDIAYDERYKAITARMVLSHRTGFPNWREDDDDDVLKLNFDPGTNYSYSGEGYQYLALVLKHIEHTDWNGLEARFQEKVAKPLGMAHTVFIENEYTNAYKAAAYVPEGKVDVENNYWSKKDKGIFSAPSSIHSEAIDFSKWMIAVMNKEGLTEESYKELFKPHSIVEERDYYDIYYTLGFSTPKIPFTNIYLHGGNNIGFTSWFALDTHKNWGYVLFTNSEYGERLGEELLLYLAAGPDKTKLYWPIGGILVIIICSFSYFVIQIRKRIKKAKAKHYKTLNE